MSLSLLWSEISRVLIADLPYFKVWRKFTKHPSSGDKFTFDVLQCSDWVNIIAITESAQIVMIRQFRHGIDDITLEIPGGIVEHGKNILEAAQEELEQEAGFRVKSMRVLGSIYPNPALQNNSCTTILGLGAEKITNSPTKEPGEEIEVVLYPVSHLSELIQNGAISHALVLAALLLYCRTPEGYILGCDAVNLP